MPATQHKTTYKNPILPGFYPDPSICRVGHGELLLFGFKKI